MRYLVFLILATLLACSSGGGNDNQPPPPTPTPTPTPTVSYINWVGSVNGTIILDVTVESFRAESTTGFITYTSGGVTTRYINTFVNASGGAYSINGIPVGIVTYVKNVSNQTVTAFVCNNGQVMDILGVTGSPSINCNTGFFPVPAIAQSFSFGIASDDATVTEPITMNALQSKSNLDSTGWMGGDAIMSIAPQ